MLVVLTVGLCFLRLGLGNSNADAGKLYNYGRHNDKLSRDDDYTHFRFVASEWEISLDRYAVLRIKLLYRAVFGVSTRADNMGKELG